MLISNLLSDLKSDLISNVGIASIFNHTTSYQIKVMEGKVSPENYSNSVIKSDISIKPTYKDRVLLWQMSFKATKFLTDIPQVFYKVIVLNQNKEIYPYPYCISVQI